MSIITNLRIIDHQETPGTVQEVIEGPDGRRVRFFVSVVPNATAYSQVWSGTEWKHVHTLLDPGLIVGGALARLMRTTEEILGWGRHER